MSTQTKEVQSCSRGGNTAPAVPHLGIQRRIERPGRTPYIQTEELVCPCCGRLSRIEWPQDNGIRITTQTHCTHRDCPGYFVTSDVVTFYERFGSTSPEPRFNLSARKVETL